MMQMQHAIDALFSDLAQKARVVEAVTADIRERSEQRNVEEASKQKQLDVVNRIKEDAEVLQERIGEVRKWPSVLFPLSELAIATDTMVASMNREMAAIEERLMQYGYVPPAATEPAVNDENRQPEKAAEPTPAPSVQAKESESMPDTPCTGKAVQEPTTPSSVRSVGDHRTPTLEDFGISRVHLTAQKRPTGLGVAAPVFGNMDDSLDEVDEDIDTLYMTTKAQMLLCSAPVVGALPPQTPGAPASLLA